MKKKRKDTENEEFIEEVTASSEEELREQEGNTDEETIDQVSPVEEVAVSLEKMEEIKAKLDEMDKKAEEYLDGWQRSRAEFANYKKRIAREYEEIHRSARGEVIKLYLEVVDDLKRALDDKPNNGEDGSWAGGIEIIYQKLLSKLESEGVKPMDALGHDFDPNIHEAIMKEENEDYKSGQIIEVMQEGYWIGDKVLRPAQVRVAA
jgi:molecular chaperone GrpE